MVNLIHPSEGEPSVYAQRTEELRDQPVFLPATDVYEKKDAIVVICDLPGVDEKQLEVSLEKGNLTITGRQDAREPERHSLLYREYRFGVFQRNFTINEDIDPAKVSAKLSSGVLTITMPKSEKAQPRKIAVHVDH